MIISRLKTFATFLTVFSLSNIIVSASRRTVKITTNIIGPFTARQEDSEQTFSYTLEQNEGKISERIDIGIHGKEWGYSEQKANHAVRANTRYDVPFILRTSDYLGPAGMDVKLSVNNYTTYALLFSNQFTIYPAGQNTINPFELPTFEYESNPIAIKIMSGNLTSYTCKYNFEKMETTFNTKYPEYLNLSNLTFSYNSGLPFENGNGYLKFLDYKNLFPYLSNDEEGYKHINIKTHFINGIGTFRYDCSFYYEPNSLQISDIWRSGFQETDKLYIPKNSYEELEKYKFELHVYGIGADKLNLLIPLIYQCSSNIFGTCNNSRYCVTGGIEE